MTFRDGAKKTFKRNSESAFFWAVAFILITGGFVLGVIVDGTGHKSVDVHSEFTGEISQLTDRSVCIGSKCGVPVYADPRNPPQVGDQVTVTTMTLNDDDVSVEAWYVR